MDEKAVSLAYDKKADVCYLSVGEPRTAVCEEIEDGVLVRTEPETGEVVGLTVLNFTQRSSESPLRIPVGSVSSKDRTTKDSR